MKVAQYNMYINELTQNAYNYNYYNTFTIKLIMIFV